MKEFWKPIKGFDAYEISSLGRVKSKERVLKLRDGRHRPQKERILKISTNKQGYIRAYLTSFSGKEQSFFAHRLVAAAFIENTHNKKYINHKNGIKDDNRIFNLEWCTTKENTIHAFRTGLRKGIRGENSNLAKLTKQTVLRIRKSYSVIKSYKKVAVIYSTSWTNVCHIINRRTWAHI